VEWSDRELDLVVARLREIWGRVQARAPREAAPPLPLRREETPYEKARREFARRERQQTALADLGTLLVGELLPPPADAGEDAELVETLRGLQAALFRHPLAFRAAFAGLVEEGRRFAATEDGAAWLERLRDSPLLPRIRLFGKLLSFSMLEEEAPDALPSAWLDGLFRLAGHPDADRVLDRLFGSGAGDV
jgi:hypothetical protein